MALARSMSTKSTVRAESLRRVVTTVMSSRSVPFNRSGQTIALDGAPDADHKTHRRRTVCGNS
jgi:hypothetical protein